MEDKEAREKEFQNWFLEEPSRRSDSAHSMLDDWLECEGHLYMVQQKSDMSQVKAVVEKDGKDYQVCTIRETESYVAINIEDFGAPDPGRVEQFLGLSYEDTCIFWKKSLSCYLGTEDPERLKEVEDKAKILGDTRILHREICRRMQGKEASEALIGICRKELGELLPKVDTLLF